MRRSAIPQATPPGSDNEEEESDTTVSEEEDTSGSEPTQEDQYDSNEDEHQANDGTFLVQQDEPKGDPRKKVGMQRRDEEPSDARTLLKKLKGIVVGESKPKPEPVKPAPVQEDEESDESEEEDDTEPPPAKDADDHAVLEYGGKFVKYNYQNLRRIYADFLKFMPKYKFFGRNGKQGYNINWSRLSRNETVFQSFCDLVVDAMVNTE
jgi:hypothetical protein